MEKTKKHILPETIITQTNSIRRRVQIRCDFEEITDPSFEKSSNINNIMKQYQKTGLLHEPYKALARYQDNTTAIPLEDAYRLINDAKELFYELPAQLRKQMDNDPMQLESFLSNPDNQDQLLKYGLIEKQAEVISPEIAPQPPAGSPDPKKPE